MAGGPFPENDHILRATAREYWHTICPTPKIIWTHDVKKIIGQGEPTALTIMNAWVEVLSTIDDPCLQIDGGPGGQDRIFDLLYVYFFPDSASFY